MEQKLRPTSPKSPEYQAHMEDKALRPPILTYIIISTVVSMLVAALAYAFVTRYVMNSSGTYQSNSSSIASVERQLSRLFSDVRTDGALRADASSVANILAVVYTEKPTLSINDVHAGYAVALTQDGWFVSFDPEQEFQQDALTLATIDGETYSVERVMHDPHTGLTYMHTNATGGQVASIASTETFQRVSALTGIEATIGSVLTSQIPVSGVVSVGDAQRTSTDLALYLLIDSTKEIPYKIPVFTATGELAGFTTENNTIIPASVALPIFSALLEGLPTNHRVDISYMSLQNLTKIEQEEELLPDAGWYVTDVTLTDAFSVVSENSQETETVALQNGDVITAIQGREVDTEMDLAAILYAQEVGDEVLMQVLRNGRTFEIKIEL